MAMMRFDPFRELEAMREAMEESFWPVARRPMEMETMALPPVDVYETDSDVVVKCAVPGLKPEDIDISISGNLLSIRGERKEEHETKRENYYRREIRAGRVYREITLPTAVNSSKAEATFENGIVTLHLPKAEEAKARKIAIKGHEQGTSKQVQAKAQGTQR